MTVDYERETRLAYTSRDRAAAYEARQTRSWTWSRVSTTLERVALQRMVAAVCRAGARTVLDAPCGTGILAPLLAGGRFHVTAADIAVAMMEHARPAYRGITTRFVCADATRLPWPAAAFDCVLSIGFLHRLPETIRREALAEAARVTSRFVIATCSIDSAAQRLKRSALALTPGYTPAPSPIGLVALARDFAAAGLRIDSQVPIAPFVSAESLFLLEKA
jgi:ubiquinone/menaquinone biosynthesis C-methylase UbiE